MNVVKEVTENVESLGACNRFNGGSLEKLIDQLFTPQGVEWVLAHAYPDMETFRKFKKYHPEKFGVYIDMGEISLSEARKVFLIGNTTATLNYQETERNVVNLLFGAKAEIHASGFSVVAIEKDRMSKVTIDKKDNAQIFQ